MRLVSWLLSAVLCSFSFQTTNHKEKKEKSEKGKEENGMATAVNGNQQRNQVMSSGGLLFKLSLSNSLLCCPTYRD